METNAVSYNNDGDVEENKKRENNTVPMTVVLKIDMHCDGCVSRIVTLSRRLEGVQTVTPDPSSNKLTLLGFMDPVKIAERLQKKSNKKVELLSPKPKKVPNENKEKKADNNTVTMVAVSTMVLKLSCSCDGCIKRIYKTVSKTKGVYQVKTDKEKDLVTVTGTMDVKSVAENLKSKLKKIVEVVPEKKEKKKKDEDNEEEISKVGSSSQPGYCLNHGLGGPYRFTEGPITGFFSEEDQTFCKVM